MQCAPKCLRWFWLACIAVKNKSSVYAFFVQKPIPSTRKNVWAPRRLVIQRCKKSSQLGHRTSRRWVNLSYITLQISECLWSHRFNERILRWFITVHWWVSIMFSPHGILEIFDSLKLRSSVAVDKINCRVLKSAALISSVILSLKFSQSVATGDVPDFSLMRKTIRKHTQGDKCFPLNYRPICWSSVPSETTKRIIHSHVSPLFESSSF